MKITFSWIGPNSFKVSEPLLAIITKAKNPLAVSRDFTAVPCPENGGARRGDRRAERRGVYIYSSDILRLYTIKKRTPAKTDVRDRLLGRREHISARGVIPQEGTVCP